MTKEQEQGIFLFLWQMNWWRKNFFPVKKIGNLLEYPQNDTKIVLNPSQKTNDFFIDQVMEFALKHSTDKIQQENSVDFFFVLFADNWGICWHSLQQKWHEVI